MDQFHEEQQFETKLQKLVSGWESCEQQESKYSKRTLESWEFGELQESSDCSSDSSSDSQLSSQESTYSKMIAETIHVLAQRSETKILECLQEDASRFYEIATMTGRNYQNNICLI